MKTSENGINLIKKFEGCVLTAYKDAVGVLTIGYGHTVGVVSGQVITQSQAEELLKVDLETYEAKVEKYNSKYNWNQNEFDALVSFAYNIGSIGQLTANGTRERDVIADKILLYNKAGGKELSGLTTRRKLEQQLFLTPVTSTVAPSTSTTPTESDSLVKVVQGWLNEHYGDYFKKYESCGKQLLKEDGVFGVKTKAALIVALQLWLNDFDDVSLTVDGVFGAKTKSACKIISKNTNAFTRGAMIVQAILFCYGYNPQLFTENFNDDCVKALKSYQSDHKLSDDGIAGKLFFESSLG